MDMHTKGRGGHGRSEKGVHPMFNALKSRHLQDRANYERMIKVKDPRRTAEGLYPTFDSLKLLGAENDAYYLDSFMAPKHRYGGGGDDHENRHRARSSSQSNRKRNSSNNRQSVNMDVLAKTLLGSLRSAASEENIYESTEAINYRKTMEEMDKQEKIRDVCKTGHPLFDALRVKNALSRPLRRESHMSSMYNLNTLATLASSRPKMARQHSHPSGTSDGNSNSNSSSGSGDEFDYVQKPNHRFSRKAVISTATTERRGHHHKHAKHEHNTHRPSHGTHNHHSRHHHSNNRNSESDDEWAIPRPKLMELNAKSQSRHRRTGVSAARIPSSVSSGPEESDSSSKSTGLR
ncbi:uncharacterized protein LOC143040336 isoform X2 [Oratosquilla oratoria]